MSRREREIMDVFYRLERATATEIRAGMADPPADPTVRKLIRVLNEKGHLVREKRGREYVYRPTVPRSDASRAAAVHLVETFFEGSAPKAVAALLDVSKDRLSDDDMTRLGELIEQAAREGR